MILVTGGTGLVGAHLLYDLVKSGKNVRAIHRESSDVSAAKKVFSYYTSAEDAERLFSKIDWAETGINDIPALTSAFNGIKEVYHCAALISFNPADNQKLRKINIEGTANIVNLCIANSVKKLCYVSSIASLGKSIQNKEITENNPWHPEESHSDYAISKYGAEIEVWRGSQEGLNVVIVNPGIIIGPGFWNSGSGLLFKKVDQGLKYHFPKVTGFVGVKDVVKAMQNTMEQPFKNEQFILVSENKDFQHVLSKIARSIDKPAPKRKLKKWMIFLGWIVQKSGRILFGNEQNITRDMLKKLFETSNFSNQKTKKLVFNQFTSIDEVITETGNIYKKESHD